MAYESLVPEAINSLSNRVRGLSQDRLAHDVRMRESGLANARLGLEAQSLAGQRDIQMAKIKREMYLDEPVTFGIAIQTSKLPDENKAILLKSIPKDILNVPTTRRKAFDAYIQIKKQIAESQEAGKKREFEAEQNRLDRESRERAAGIRASGEKDTRPTMQKEVEFIQETLGITKQQALEKYQKDKSLPERIRLYNNELDRLSKDFDFQDLTQEQKSKKVSELRKSYEIPVNDRSSKQLTKDQATEYMKKAYRSLGGKASKQQVQQEAMRMAKEDGYQF